VLILPLDSQLVRIGLSYGQSLPAVSSTTLTSEMLRWLPKGREPACQFNRDHTQRTTWNTCSLRTYNTSHISYYPLLGSISMVCCPSRGRGSLTRSFLVSECHKHTPNGHKSMSGGPGRGLYALPHLSFMTRPRSGAEYHFEDSRWQLLFLALAV
jgi:hypothetical protein